MTSETKAALNRFGLISLYINFCGLYKAKAVIVEKLQWYYLTYTFSKSGWIDKDIYVNDDDDDDDNCCIVAHTMWLPVSQRYKRRVS